MNPLIVFAAGALLFIAGIVLMLYVYTSSAREKPVTVRFSITEPGDYEAKVWPSSGQATLRRMR